MSNRLVVLLTALAFLLLLVLAPLWGFPHIEDELDEEALDVASYTANPDATVEWNGRDGYLTVPEGTANAEQLAADLGDIRGARDVEIAFVAPASAPAPAPEPEQEEEPSAPVPASFRVDWLADGSIEQMGDAPVGLAAAVTDLGVAEPTTAEGLIVGEDVPATMATLAPLIGNELVRGTIWVDDDMVRIVGVAGSQADFDKATAALADANANVEISVAEQAAAQDALDQLLALKKIEFETGTAVPTAATEGVLDEVAAVLNQYESISVDIVGFTDSRGDDDANQVLSEERATAVLSALVSRGVDTSRLSAEGKGEADPIDSNDTDEGRQRNRRVEILAREDV